MIELLGRLREEIQRRVPALQGVPLSFEYPPNPTMGDLSLSVAFDLAKRQRRKPRELAMEIAGQLQNVPLIGGVEVAGGGYVNLFFDRRVFLQQMLMREKAGGTRPAVASRAEKVIVEHTNINPNKAAHVGHLRNAVLGDALVRLLRYQGYRVEAQNYIDDTGVQVADVVCAFTHLKKMSLEQVAAIPDPFDYYCWDLYAEFSSHIARDKELEWEREQTLHLIEQGGNPTSELASHVATRIVRAHLATMKRIGVRYDLLAWEGDILHRRFWATCFDLLKRKGAIHLATDGKNAGCWVMDLPDLPEAEKVIVRSSGVVTYVGKDIAYQMWKFGVLGMDFYYREWERSSDGTILWSTSSEPSAGGSPAFGGAARVYNVIDVRQAYLQKVVSLGLQALGYTDQSESSLHFSYEMVALTTECARELGYELSTEEAARPFVEVSGRKGLGVKADDLLTALEKKAYEEVAERNPQYDPPVLREMAGTVASGALRYFMLKFGRTKVLAFDLKEALNFDGETGPYLQYAAVRARNIFAKLAEREGLTEEGVGRIAAAEASYEVINEDMMQDVWELVWLAARLETIVEQSVGSLELSFFAKYAYTVAQRFNAFYHKHPILHEEDPRKKNLRLLAAWYLSERMQTALELMGIGLPERM